MSWDEAFDVMAEKFKARAEEARARRRSACSAPANGRSGKATPRCKLMKAGFRSNNLDPNARHCMASAAVGFMRTFGIDEPMGCYDDIEAADAFVLWGSNMAEMHPILWTRVTDRRLSAPHVKVAVLSTFEHRSFELADIAHHLHAADRPRDPQLHRQPHHQDQPGEQGLRRQAHARSSAATTDIGYGLRPEHPLQKKATGRRQGRRRHRHDASTNTPSSSPTTRWRRPPRCPACR